MERALVRLVSVSVDWAWKGVSEATWNCLGLGELGERTERPLSPVKPHPCTLARKNTGSLVLNLCRKDTQSLEGLS